MENTKTNKIYRALHAFSNCNKAILSAKDEIDLAKNVCDTIVNSSGYQLAWIGYYGKAGTKQLKPVAQRGFEEGYLERVCSSWSETEYGQCFPEFEFQTGSRIIARKILTEPDFKPLSNDSKKRGYESYVAMPLLSNEMAIGVLNLYATEPDSFDNEELVMISELADNITYGIILMRDNKKLQKEQDEKYLLSSVLFEKAVEAMMITDVNGVIEMINPVFTTITGYHSEESVGKNVSILKSEKHDKEFFQNMRDTLQAKGCWQGEIWNRKKTGDIYLTKQSIRALKDRKGRTLKYVSAFYDIVDIDQSENEIKYKAYHDTLTGLPNRMLFIDRFNAAINRIGRNETSLAVIFLDLDNFKNVNDVLGHAVGDILLKKAASRLVSCLRKVDTVARFGGDEFTILLENLTRDQDIIIVSRKIIESFASSFSIKGEEIFVSTSMGISLYPDDGKNVETLMKNADLAMYHAKELGKGNYQFFTKRLNDKAVQRTNIEKALRKALENNEMVAYYQPIVNLKTGQIVGMETLVRWRHPNGTIVPPNDFIPLAEETGLIVKVDELMLSAACDFSKKLKRKSLAGIHISVNVSVNLSAIVLERGNLVDIINKKVEDAGLTPRDIGLEVTERSIIKNVDFAIGTLQRLRDKGYSVSMDDFGTGYSSLNSFIKLPINVLKVDRSFLINLPTDPKARYVTKALITMAHELGIKVVAEGVETQEQIDLLMLMGCDEMQGYFFSPPLPQDNMEKLLIDGANLHS